MAQKYILTVKVPGQPARQVVLAKSRYTFGRSPENDIVIAVSYVSRQHGQLELTPQGWVFSDLGSHHGTFIGNTQVEGKKSVQARLENGSLLRISDSHGNSVSLQLSYSAPGAEAGKESTSGMVAIQSHALQRGKTLIIGRESGSSIHLSAPTVSRRHATLASTPQGWVLTDLNSHNGTFINNQRLTRPHLLREGDKVQIGPFRLTFVEGLLKQEVASRGIRLDGIRLSIDVGTKEKPRRILDEVSISCYPREFVGLVGSSGAGKSTLMRALSGLQPPRGKVLVEGDDLYDHFDFYRTLIGYVPQDDILHKELTVEQALTYSARLRLPSDISDAEVTARVDKVLEQVELSGQKSQTINSLSGGQRKRASIAVELLADPPLFFLDEPTSGLDPGLEKKMMHTMRQLADGGKTIILVTHATANITQCDHVAFLSQGKMVYFGPPDESNKFFGVATNDFADIYSEIGDPGVEIARKKAARWEEAFRKSDFYKKFIINRLSADHAGNGDPGNIHAQREGYKRISSFQQFFLLTRRYFDLIIRDRMSLFILLAIMPILAVLLIMIANTNWLVGDPFETIQSLLGEKIAGGKESASYSIVGKSQAMLFMMAFASVLLGLFSSAYEIVKEKTVYDRERMVFLRLVPYLASKVVLLGGFAALQCFLFLLVIRLKVEFPAQGIFLPTFFELYISLFLGCLAAIMLGLFISALAASQNTVTYSIMGLLFFQILFAGVFFTLPGATQNFSYITLSRWTTEGLGTTVNLEYLNTLTQTRFDPSEFSKVVSFEVEKPDPDWQCVTVEYERKEIPGCAAPIEMPVIKENELITVTETVEDEVTVDPDPRDVKIPYEFAINYNHSLVHLFFDWGMLIFLGAVFAVGALVALKAKDVRK